MQAVSDGRGFFSMTLLVAGKDYQTVNVTIMTAQRSSDVTQTMQITAAEL